MSTNHETLTRAAMAARIHAETDVARPDALRLIGAIIDHIVEALSRGENVKISGFGSFNLNDKAARIGRNPKTGVEAIVTARRVVTFRPSADLRAKIAPVAGTGPVRD